MEIKPINKYLHEHRSLLLLVFVSLGLKLVLLHSMEVLPEDGPMFISQAEKFVDGAWKEGLALNRYLFLYPLLIVCVHYLIPDMVLAGQLISLTASVLALIPIFLLTRGLFGATAAFWGGLAFVVAPGFNDYAVKVMREPAFLCLFAWAVYFAWCALEFKKTRHFVLFFIFSVTSSLFRVEGIFLPILFIAFLLFVCLSDKEKRPVAIKASFVSLIFVALFYGFANYVDQNYASFIKYNNVTFYLDNVFNGGVFNPIPEIKAGLKSMEISSSYGWNHNDFASIARENIRLIYFIGLMFCISNIVFMPFFILFFTGVYFGRKYSQGNIFLIIAAVIYSIVCFMFLLNMNFIEPRYAFAISVFLYPWIGLGVEKIFLFKNKNYIANIMIPVVVLFLFFTPFYESITSHEYQVSSGKEAGIWLAEQVEFNNKKMIANNGEIPFYSGRNSDDMIHVFCRDRDDFYSMEQIGKREGADIMAIVIKKHKEDIIPDFFEYELKKRFDDKKYSSFVYYRK